MDPYRTPCPVPSPEETAPLVLRVEPPPADRGGSAEALCELSEHWSEFWRDFDSSPGSAVPA